MIDATDRTQTPLDAERIESQLFRPSPRYLLAAFCQPASVRERVLADAERWFGLDAALAQLAPGVPLTKRVGERWLDLLLACQTRVPGDSEGKEIRALVAALRSQMARVEDGEPATLDGLWESMSSELRSEVGEDRRGTNSATLRGRRWAHLRTQLARVLAGAVAQAAPQSLIPRQSRKPSMFHDADFERIRERVTSETQAPGWAVITAGPTSGRSELALAYAEWGRKKHHYDQVFVLRASDPLLLEHDFLMIGDVLSGSRSKRAEGRRAIFERLETSDRWLMVFQQLNDPAVLLPFLPWNTNGHFLCTYAKPTDVDNASAAAAWMRYLHIDLGLGIDASPTGTQAGAAGNDLLRDLELDWTRRLLASTLPPAAREDPRLSEIARLVGRSRFATGLAHAWFRHTAAADSTDSESGRRHGEAQLGAYLKLWDRAEARTRASDVESPPRMARDQPEYLAGVHAALVLLAELGPTSGPGRRWRNPEDVADPQLEADALELLTRLEPFSDKALTSTTFPVVLLDEAAYAVANRIDDRRLRFLEDLGLTNIAVDVPHDPYFDVHAAVLDAVRVMRPEPSASRRRAKATGESGGELSLAIASRTMLDVMGKPLVAGMPPDEDFQLVPHAAALARRELENPGPDGHPQRPLVAIELYLRAALCHLSRDRVRAAKNLMDNVAKAFAEQIDDPPVWPLDGIDRWPGRARTKRSPRPVLERMGEVVRAIRSAGFAPQARDVYEHLLKLVPEELDDNPDTNSQVARVHFEGAMVYHDLDDIDAANVHLAYAHDIWEELGDRRWVAVAANFNAELLLDTGMFAEARTEAESAKAERELLLRDAVSKEDWVGLRADLARSDLVLGRIAYVEGRLEQALTHFAASVAGWDEAFEQAKAIAAQGESAAKRGGVPAPIVDLPAINRVTALSYLALAEALLGRLSAAGDHARDAHDTVKRLHPRAHQHSVGVLNNAAHVLRLTGSVTEAASDHRHALRVAERTCGLDHRVTMVVRRKTADSLLDAGKPAEALDELLQHLERVAPRAREHDASVGRLHMAARAWTSLGRLLIDNALTAHPLLADRDRDLLGLALRVLEHARQLYPRASGPDRYANPGFVSCLASLGEIAIRRDDENAEALIKEALDLAQQQYPAAAPPLIALEAKRLRAQALTVTTPKDVEPLLEKATLLPELPSNLIESPTDRLEIALARIEAKALGVEHGLISDPTSVYKEAQDLHEAALRPLQSAIGQQQHQLVARSYGELAGLAERFGMQRQRARNERERDRLRPRFEVDIVTLNEQLDPLLGHDPAELNGQLSDDETRLLERHSLFTRVMSMDLAEDIAIESGTAAESFLNIVADNLRNDRGYQFLVHTSNGLNPQTIAHRYRSMLREAGVGEAELQRCEFRTAKYASLVNFGIYKLDRDGMARAAQRLLERIGPMLSEDAEVAYHMPVSGEIDTDAVMDEVHFRRCLDFFEDMWDIGDEL